VTETSGGGNFSLLFIISYIADSNQEYTIERIISNPFRVETNSKPIELQSKRDVNPNKIILLRFSSIIPLTLLRVNIEVDFLNYYIIEPVVYEIQEVMGSYDEETEVWIRGKYFGPSGNLTLILTLA
jgi:hypothetical protein